MHTYEKIRPCLARVGTRLGFLFIALNSPLSEAVAQRAGVGSPGAPVRGGLGQTTRFDNEFNPAISLSADLLFDWKEFDGPSEDGVNLSLRRVDLLVADWIDPNAFVWATVAYEEGELGLDETAIEYVGLPGNHSLRGGRFFLDFGKQMQMHIEQLRTIERPLVLRDYLGEELAADGLQWDNWFGVGDTTLVRFSLGAFSDVSGGGHHHEDESEEDALTLTVAERKEADDIGFAARLTAMSDVGENGTIQFGASARFLPDFAFDQPGTSLSAKNQSNAVYGLDLTYGWVSDDGVKRWTAGGEVLHFVGDLSAALDDNGTPANAADDFIVPYDDAVTGSYWFVDHGWTLNDSAGVQYSMIQEPEVGESRASELDLYYTRQLSEFLRLRVGLTFAELQYGEDSVRLAFQLTGFVGPHGHGLNW